MKRPAGHTELELRGLLDDEILAWVDPDTRRLPPLVTIGAELYDELLKYLAKEGNLFKARKVVRDGWPNPEIAYRGVIIRRGLTSAQRKDPADAMMSRVAGALGSIAEKRGG